MIIPRILIAALTVNELFAGCVPLTGSRILGRDLAQADPQFAGLPPALVIGFSPAAGAKRVFSPAELRRIGKQNGVEFPKTNEVCFELLMRHIGEEEMRPAMMHVLPEGAQIRFAENPSFNVPAGELSFSVDQLEPAQPGANGVRLWRGYVTYAERQRAAVWARVMVTVHSNAVVATKDLAPGVPVAAASLRSEVADIGPGQPAHSPRIPDIVGKIPKHPIRAGAVIALADVAEAPAVKAGDVVRVEVRSGLAQLGFDATVEAPAREGDIIELRNPISGKTFRARLKSSTRAVVMVGAERRDEGEKP